MTNNDKARKMLRLMGVKQAEIQALLARDGDIGWVLEKLNFMQSFIFEIDYKRACLMLLGLEV